MKRAVGRSVAPNIFEGRALTLKILKAQMTLGRRGHRASGRGHRPFLRSAPIQYL
jgi:hypothetical protein